MANKRFKTVKGTRLPDGTKAIKLWYEPIGSFIWEYETRNGHQYKCISFTLPEDPRSDPERNGLRSLLVVGPGDPKLNSKKEAFWTWDGDLNYPTLKPSIAAREPSHDGKGKMITLWHGYLTKGIFEACE